MQNQALFKKDILQNFDFTGQYIGYVLDNSDFDDSLKVKVFIPELFGYNYSSKIPNQSTEVSINTDHILNKNEININRTVEKSEFIYARPLIHRHTLSTTDEFILGNKPSVSDKVIVSFLNGNPSNCIYENSIFLSEGEKIRIIGDSSLNNTSQPAVTVITNNINSRSTTTKVVWDIS